MILEYRSYLWLGGAPKGLVLHIKYLLLSSIRPFFFFFEYLYLTLLVEWQTHMGFYM